MHISEGLSKLGILLGSPPISLFDILLTTREGLGTRFSPRWFVYLLRCGSFHFVYYIPPFLGALVFYD